jgi:RNA polymerase sigma-70 factor (ECF subfamily)
LPADPDERFESIVLPHLDAAYNLARHLLRHDDDAADAVQEASLRALRYFGGYRGGNARAWLLAIVRHTCYSRLSRPWRRAVWLSFDESLHSPEPLDEGAGSAPERDTDRSRVRAALAGLPERFREVIVLHEMEGFAYKEIAAITNVPIGTVMSRLSRARERLQRALAGEQQEGDHGLR